MSEETEKKFERLYLALTNQVRAMESRIDELIARNGILEAEKKLWALEKEHQQKIIQDAINKANALSNQYLEANQKLQAELMRLKNGNKCELADKGNIGSEELHDPSSGEPGDQRT